MWLISHILASVSDLPLVSCLVPNKFSAKQRVNKIDPRFYPQPSMRDGDRQILFIWANSSSPTQTWHSISLLIKPTEAGSEIVLYFFWLGGHCSPTAKIISRGREKTNVLDELRSRQMFLTDLEPGRNPRQIRDLPTSDLYWLGQFHLLS